MGFFSKIADAINKPKAEAPKAPDLQAHKAEVSALVMQLAAEAEKHSVVVVMDTLAILIRATAGILGPEEQRLATAHMNQFNQEVLFVNELRHMAGETIHAYDKAAVTGAIEQEKADETVEAVKKLVGWKDGK